MAKILQVDNGKEIDNQYIKQYCIEYDIKLILSSLYHPQTNGSVEVTHKEIQKYIFNEYLNKKEKFNIEDSLFNIIKIHNNKQHSTTNRISKENRDLTDQREIDITKQEIIRTMQEKNASADEIQYDKFYVIDFNNIKIDKDKIIKDIGKKKKKIIKILIKYMILF